MNIKMFIFFLGPADPNCSLVLITNKTTDSMAVDLINLQSPKELHFTAEIFDGNISERSVSFNEENKYHQSITDLESGKRYTFKIFAISKQDIKSVNSCLVENEYTCK